MRSGLMLEQESFLLDKKIQMRFSGGFMKKIISAMITVIALANVAFANDDTKVQVAWNQPSVETCFECVVRSTITPYKFNVLATNVAAAEEYAVAQAARKEPGLFTLIGKICSQTAMSNCK
jgi:cell division protein FtsI/penicillin-binding protein 2